MIKRKNGRLTINTLDLQIFLGELYLNCETEEEIDFLHENILGYNDLCADERMDEIE